MKHWKTVAATTLFATLAIWMLSAQSVSQARIIGQSPVIYDRAFYLEEALVRTIHRVERLEETVREQQRSIDSLKKTNNDQAAHIKRLENRTVARAATARRQ